MRALAEKVWQMALDGDIQAIKEVADRHDGKAPQGVELTGADGGPVDFRAVEWNIVKPEA